MQRTLAPFMDETFDLLVLGGGITGAGVALDAATRGLRVALIDRGDFASGTSSASSKLIHGGLRYLEHGHVQQVYEALHERRVLLRNAPHLVHPLRFVIPFYEGGRVPAWKWRLGLTLYDVLSGRDNIRRSRPLSAKHVTHSYPVLRTAGLGGAGEFFDAQMDDARVCLDVIQTAWQHGARVANYVEAIAFETRSGEIQSVRVLDRVGGQEFLVTSRQVLNATGPWVDAVCRLAGDNAGPHLQPTKGIHLIAPGRDLMAAFLLLHPRDGRVFFVIPWLGKTLIGTTDTFATVGPDTLTVQPREVAYLLEGHNHYLQPALTEKDVLGSFAGLRPLLRSSPRTPSALSREFRLVASPSGLLSVVGGKFTTYRRMAEIITDEVARRLGRRRACRTRDMALDGAPAEPWKSFVAQEVTHICQKHGLAQDTARHLLSRYGRRASEVAAYVDIDETLAEPLHPEEPDIGAEIAYQRDHEMAQFPADHFLRRTRLGLFRPRSFPPE